MQKILEDAGLLTQSRAPNNSNSTQTSPQLTPEKIKKKKVKKPVCFSPD